MKTKTVITIAFFIGVIFAGSAVADCRPTATDAAAGSNTMYDWQSIAGEGQRGVFQQESHYGQVIAVQQPSQQVGSIGQIAHGGNAASTPDGSDADFNRQNVAAEGQSGVPEQSSWNLYPEQAMTAQLPQQTGFIRQVAYGGSPAGTSEGNRAANDWRGIAAEGQRGAPEQESWNIPAESQRMAGQEFMAAGSGSLESEEPC
jgi:hypothetical protein